jgi:hypothetical protein
MRIPLGALPLVGDLVDMELDGEVTTGEVVAMPLGGGVSMTSCGPADGSDPHVWVRPAGEKARLTPARDLVTWDDTVDGAA